MKLNKIINDKVTKILLKVIILFILIQPIFDIYMGVVGEKIDILGLSLVTITRILVVSITFLYCLIKSFYKKENIKLTNMLIVYFVLVILYVISHHFNIVRDTSYFYKNNLYNIIAELNYVLRLLMPIVLIYNIIILKIKFRDIVKSVIISGVIIATVIIVTNLLKIAYCSYNGDSANPVDKITISGSILSWFGNNTYSFENLASKGLFVSANQISGVLSIILVVLVYDIYKNTNKKTNYIYLTLISLSMIILGTRSASYISIFLIVFVLIINVVKLLYNKEKKQFINICFSMLILIGITSLYSISPQTTRKMLGDYETEYVNSEESTKVLQKNKKITKYLNDEKLFMKYLGVTEEEFYSRKNEYLCKYISENYKTQYIAHTFIQKIYPYTDDPEFWIKMFNESFEIKADSRQMEIKIVSRIMEKNNNKLDILFGIGATPLNQRGFMVENDLIAHYYQLGVIGILLFILPYVLIAFLVIIKTLEIFIKNKKIIIKDDTASMLVILLTLLIGYISGHIIDEYIVMIYTASIAGTIVVNYTNKEGIFNGEKGN